MKKNPSDAWEVPHNVKKILLKMRFTLLLVCLFAFSAMASSQKVTLSVQNVTLNAALNQLKNQSGVRILFDSEQTRNILCETCHFQDAELKDVLDRLLENTALGYQEIGGVYVIRQLPPLAKAIKVSGRVVDSQGHPLPGVSVVLKGTTTGVATDVNGNFELMVSKVDRPVLVFSFVGMETKEVAVVGEKPMQVVMKEDAEVMEEVVVTGYQSIKSGRATGSFQILKAEDMDNIVATDFTKKIEGAVPGLMVDPDGKMLIRGKGTFQAETAPLIVVDGFPMESSTLNLNPADIDQITVLKDAASASIYGVRGANGVVVITTKRGSATGKLSVSATANVQVGQAPRLKDLEYLNSSDHVDLEWELYKAGILNMTLMYGAAYTEVGDIYQQVGKGTLSETDAQKMLERYRSYDNRKDLEKYFYQSELLQQYNVSMRGGGEKNSFYAAVGFNKQQEKVIGNDGWRANFILNNDIHFTNSIKLQLSLKGNYYKENDNGIDVVSDGIRPYVRMLDNKGNYVNEFYGIPQNKKDELMQAGYLDWTYNRLQNRRMNDNTLKGSNVAANINLSVDVFDGLNLSTGFVYETGADKRENYHSLHTYYTRNMINRFTYMDPQTKEKTYHLPKGGMLQTDNSWLYNWTWRGTAAYSKSIGDFDLSVSAGLEMSSFRTVGAVDYYYGYDPQTLVNIQIDMAELQTGVDGYDTSRGKQMLYDKNRHTDVENRYASFFALANFTYKKKYDLFGSYRLDKTNLFGRSSEYRDNPAYSIGAKWTISSEEFFQADWVSRLALKVSYGLSGNIDKSTSPYLIGYESADFWTGQPSLQFSYPENPLLSWEKSFVWNVGAEFGLFGERLNGSVEYYRKKSTDVLAAEQVDYTCGWGGTFYSSVMKNSASIVNSGIDLNLNGLIIDRGLKYNMGLILSYNHNEVVKINRATASISDLSSTTPLKGQPVDYVYAYRNAGLDETGEPMVYNRAGERLSWTKMGDFTLDDIKFVGRSTPPVFGSWTNSLKWKGATLDLMFTYKFGHKIYLPYTATTSNADQQSVHKSVADRWRKTGDEKTTWVPKVSNSPYEDPQRKMSVSHSDKLADDGAIIRLRSLNIGYSFKSLLTKQNLFKDITLRFSGENLFYWSKSGYDTDYLTTYGADNLLNFPAVRRFAFSLSLQF